MFHLIDFCRLCLSFKGEFSNICNDDIMEKIVACISDLEFDEKLPGLICMKCSEQLDRFFEFRNQCLRSEFLLNGYIDKFPFTQNCNKFVNTQLKVNLLQNFATFPKILGNVQISNKQSLESSSSNNNNNTTKACAFEDYSKCKVILKDIGSCLNKEIQQVNESNSLNTLLISDNNVTIDVSDEDDVFLEEEDDEININSTSEIQNGKRKSDNSEYSTTKKPRLQETKTDETYLHADITENVKIRKRAVQIRAQEKNKQNLDNQLQGNKAEHEENIQANTKLCNKNSHQIKIPTLNISKNSVIYKVTRIPNELRYNEAQISSFIDHKKGKIILNSTDTTQNLENNFILETSNTGDSSMIQSQNVNSINSSNDVTKPKSPILKSLLVNDGNELGTVSRKSSDTNCSNESQIPTNKDSKTNNVINTTNNIDFENTIARYCIANKKNGNTTKKGNPLMTVQKKQSELSLDTIQAKVIKSIDGKRYFIVPNISDCSVKSIFLPKTHPVCNILNKTVPFNLKSNNKISLLKSVLTKDATVTDSPSIINQDNNDNVIDTSVNELIIKDEDCDNFVINETVFNENIDVPLNVENESNQIPSTNTEKFQDCIISLPSNHSYFNHYNEHNYSLNCFFPSKNVSNSPHKKVQKNGDKSEEMRMLQKQVYDPLDILQPHIQTFTKRKKRSSKNCRGTQTAKEIKKIKNSGSKKEVLTEKCLKERQNRSQFRKHLDSLKKSISMIVPSFNHDAPVIDTLNSALHSIETLKNNSKILTDKYNTELHKQNKFLNILVNIKKV